MLASVNQLAPRVDEVELLKKKIAPIFMKFQSEGKITANDFTKICRGLRLSADKIVFDTLASNEMMNLDEFASAIFLIKFL